MHPCPTCKGTGSVAIRTTTHEVGKEPIKKSVTIGCYVCDGKKRITDAKARRMKAQADMWCQCKESHGSAYFENGDGSHGWNCNGCGKVTQVG